MELLRAIQYRRYSNFVVLVVLARARPFQCGHSPHPGRLLRHCKLWRFGRVRRLRAKEACSAQRRGVSVRRWTHNSIVAVEMPIKEMRSRVRAL